MSFCSKSQRLNTPVIRNANGDVFVVTKKSYKPPASIIPPPLSETQSCYRKPSAVSAGDRNKPLTPYSPNSLRNLPLTHDPRPRSCHDTNFKRGAPCRDGTSNSKRFLTTNKVAQSQVCQPTGFGNPGILSEHTQFIRKLQNS
ncbi:hypothetical protein RCL1_008542 [Eukaryota sp. TZLM3-RCL]